MNENFVIDLTPCLTTPEMINGISNAFNTSDAKGKQIVLKLKDFQLSQSQMLSIKSLIISYGSTLYGIETTSLITKQLCENMSIQVITPDEVDKISKSIEEENKVVEEEALTPVETAPIIDKSLDVIYGKQEENSEAAGEFQLFQGNDFKEIIEDVKPAEKTVSEVQEEIKEEAVSPVEQTASPEEEKENAEELEEKTEEEKEEEIIEIPDEDDMPTYTKGYDENENDETIEEISYKPPTNEPVKLDNMQTLYVHQTLRSGQTVEFDGHVVIIGDCHPGSEIKATGDITIWGVLGSIAHAGIRGDRSAKIRALKMNAVQLRIADCYSRRPDGTNIPYIIKSSTFTPEEARIVDNGIVLYKTYQKED